MGIAGEKPVDGLSADVAPPATRAAIQHQVEQNLQLGGSGEQAGVTGNAAVRVPCVEVVDFASEHVPAPPIPCTWIAGVVISEVRVVHHMPLVAVARLRRGELGESARPRSEGCRTETEWPVQLSLDESVERIATDTLDDVAEQHESKVAVVATVADAPAEGHVADDVVRLRGVRP